MKNILVFLAVALLAACNDSATVTKPNDQDNTRTRDTTNNVSDSVSNADSLRGR